MRNQEIEEAEASVEYSVIVVEAYRGNRHMTCIVRYQAKSFRAIQKTVEQPVVLARDEESLQAEQWSRDSQREVFSPNQCSKFVDFRKLLLLVANNLIGIC